MKGWQTLFSKSQQTGKKPFPKDRFFSPEELEFLDTTQSELSLLEKWALQLGKWARISQKRPISPSEMASRKIFNLGR